MANTLADDQESFNLQPLFFWSSNEQLIEVASSFQARKIVKEVICLK